MDTETITKLLNSSGGGASTSLLPDFDTIMKSLAPYMIALTVVSILFTLLYLVSVINKWRANKAIIDIKKTLIEMNERDKLRMAQTVMTTAPAPVVNEQPNIIETASPTA